MESTISPKLDSVDGVIPEIIYSRPISDKRPKYVRRLLGIITVFLLFFSAVLGFIFLQFPCTVLVYFAPYLYKDVTNFLISTWLLLPPSLIKQLYGTKLRIFSRDGKQAIPDDGWNLVIMNHRTRTDWYYLSLSFLLAASPLQFTRKFKVVLKSSLRHIPGFGWAMQASRFLFLDRNWEKDKLHLTNSLLNLSTHGPPHSLLIFPEGTDFEPNSLASSNRFASKCNLPPYYNVLHPRVTGTVHTIATLSKTRCLQNIVNITVFYPDYIPSHESSILFGDTPREIWYFVDLVPGDGDAFNYTNQNNNQEEEKTSEWLKKIWDEKEKMLSTIEEFRSNPQPEQIGFIENKLPVDRTLMPKLIIAFWATYVIAIACLIYFFLFAKLFFLTGVLVTVAVAYKYGGWDKLEIKLQEELFSSKI